MALPNFISNVRRQCKEKVLEKHTSKTLCYFGISLYNIVLPRSRVDRYRKLRGYEPSRRSTWKHTHRKGTVKKRRTLRNIERLERGFCPERVVRIMMRVTKDSRYQGQAKSLVSAYRYACIYIDMGIEY